MGWLPMRAVERIMAPGKDDGCDVMSSSVPDLMAALRSLVAAKLPPAAEGMLICLHGKPPACALITLRPVIRSTAGSPLPCFKALFHQRLRLAPGIEVR
jgi:hypothetical protein